MLDKRTRFANCIKALTKYDGAELGMESLRNIISIYVVSNEKAITECLRLLGGVGVLTETTQFHFKVNIKEYALKGSFEL